MPTFTLLVWLVSTLGAGHPVLANLTNEQVSLIQYSYERSVESGIPPAKFIKLVICESGLNKKAIGDNGKANGLLQFWQGTFNTYKKIHGLEGTYDSPFAQINLATAMIKNGGIRHWKNCGSSVGLLAE